MFCFFRLINLILNISRFSEILPGSVSHPLETGKSVEIVNYMFCMFFDSGSWQENPVNLTKSLFT